MPERECRHDPQGFEKLADKGTDGMPGSRAKRPMEQDKRVAIGYYPMKWVMKWVAMRPESRRSNPPRVGLILCALKDEGAARYVLEGLPNGDSVPHQR